MNKAITLLLIIALPVLIIVGYYKFAKNHYQKLPIYGPKEAIQLAVNGKPVFDTIYHTTGNFGFTDQNGKSFGTQQLDQKLYVVNFFFTDCKSICIDMSRGLKRIQETFINNPLLQIVSLSVDPENDSPSKLSSYATENGIIYERWKLLTGTKDSIYNVSEKRFFVTANDNGTPEHKFIHTDQSLLIDNKQRIRGIYNATDSKDINRMMEDIRTLIVEVANDSMRVYTH